jgi:hypothetical protein
MRGRIDLEFHRRHRDRSRPPIPHSERGKNPRSSRKPTLSMRSACTQRSTKAFSAEISGDQAIGCLGHRTSRFLPQKRRSHVRTFCERLDTRHTPGPRWLRLGEHAMELLESVRGLIKTLRREKLEQHHRHVSVRDLLTDRWEIARDYGFGNGTSCNDNVDSW